jgi:crotonobetainyl-CoA:carnitine CoA-transferase CaiB-like acyl-CoA transferase
VVISEWTSTRLPMDAARELQEAGIAAGPVLDEAAALSDPQLHERGFFHLLEHPSCGVHFHPGANFAMSRTPPQMWRAAPTLGQDNEYVYKDVIGVTDAEYDELIADGHVGTEYL